MQQGLLSAEVARNSIVITTVIKLHALDEFLLLLCLGISSASRLRPLLSMPLTAWRSLTVHLFSFCLFSLLVGFLFVV